MRYLAKRNCTNSPKDKFLTDLSRAIQTWQTEGDLVIVGGDMNDDVRSQPIQQKMRLCGLVEGPTMHHSHPPATHNRGSLPIDGIFLPNALIDHCESGYLDFGEAIPSDHRAIWIDILAQFICPEGTEAIERPIARRLHCKDPRVVSRYNNILWESLQETKMAQRAQELLKQTGVRLTLSQQLEYESIDKTTTELKRHAENKCRKLKAGTVPWCPQVSKAINRILYWKGLNNRLKGCAIGSSVLRQRAKKGGITNHPSNYQLDPLIIQEHLQQAYKSFNRLKADPDRHDTWIANLIQAQAQAKGMSTKSLWKQHGQTEIARNTARLVRSALRSLKPNRSLQAVMGPTADRERQEFSSKYLLEKACLDEAG